MKAFTFICCISGLATKTAVSKPSKWMFLFWPNGGKVPALGQLWRYKGAFWKDDTEAHITSWQSQRRVTRCSFALFYSDLLLSKKCTASLKHAICCPHSTISRSFLCSTITGPARLLYYTPMLAELIDPYCEWAWTVSRLNDTAEAVPFHIYKKCKLTTLSHTRRQKWWALWRVFGCICSKARSMLTTALCHMLCHTDSLSCLL